MNVFARGERSPVPVSPAASYRFAGCLGVFFGAIIASGQEAAIQKIVMTGDAVPGLEEDFAFFRGVHLFEDGEVGFAGVTTRTGSFFQNAPRGIYLSNTSGALSVIAEIDDADAFRSFGLPNTIMDSGADKTFAFDYFNSIDTGNFPVLGRKVLGEDREAFNPDDGSFMLVSHANLPDTTFFQGNFLTIWGGIMLNAPGDVLADATFEFEDGDVAPLRGLFVAIETNDVRNIVFENDPAPIAEDAPFTTIRKASMADNGNVFFSSILGGANVPNGTRETLWMENQGLFQLLLREGHDAPGLPGKIISLTGLNMHVADMRGEHLVVLAGATRPGGRLRRVVWLGDTSGDNLTPIIHHNSSPVLEDDDYFTATDQGPIAFTNLDGNAVLLDDSGNVYFAAGGKFADGSGIFGIWKYAVAEGLNQLLVQTNPSFRNFSLLGANNLGAVAFLADNQDVEEVWTRSPSGDLARLISSGETVESRPIIGFADHSTVSGLFNESNKTLGLPKKFRQLNDSGDLVFVARFSDTENDDDNRADEAILLASTTPPQTERYLWNGEAGDDDWHKVMNWEDLDTGLPATRAPGDGEGTEEVVIPDAEVTIDDKAVHLRNLSAGGSLLVNHPLTLEEASEIGGLELNANLINRVHLLLDGVSTWNSGDLLMVDSFVPARIEIAEGSRLSLTSAANGGGDEKLLQQQLVVSGEVVHENGVLVDLSNGGTLEIDGGGMYVIEGGTIFTPASSLSPSVENRGAFVSSGPVGGQPVMIQADFSNEGGDINVPTGTLRMEKFLVLDGGEITVDSNAVTELSMADGADPDGHGLQIKGDATIRGQGEFKINAGSLMLLEGQTLTADLNSDSGALELNDQVVLDGGGTLFNTGRLVINDANNKSHVVNEGTLVVTGADLSITDGTLENRSLMTLDRWVFLDAENEGEEGVVFENKGTLEIEGGEVLIKSLKPTLQFKNAHDGNIIKRGDFFCDIDTFFINEGFINVTAGIFRVSAGGTFGSPLVGAPSSINVEAGSEMVFRGPVDPIARYVFVDDYEFVGAGNVLFDLVHIDLPVGVTLTNKGTDLSIRPPEISDGSDAIPFLRGSMINESGTLAFSSDISSTTILIKDDFINGEGGIVEMMSGFDLRLERPAHVVNKGELRIGGGNSKLDPNDSGSSLSDDLFTNGGNLIYDGGGAENSYRHTLEVPFEATVVVPVEGVTEEDRQKRENGRVLLTGFAKADFRERSLGTESFTLNFDDFDRVSDIVLNRGIWEAEAGSSLSFDSILDFGWSVSRISEGAEVILHGNQEGVKDGDIGNILFARDKFENDGRLTLLGATINAEGKFTNNGRVHGDPGRFEIPDGFRFLNTNHVSGNVVIVGETLNRGFISAGSSPGTIRVVGDFVQESDGHLFIELGGTIPGEDYDQFLVEGIATLAGRLTLACVDDIFPEHGATFVPIVADGFEGGFDDIIIDVPSSRQNFTIATNGTEITAQAVVLDVSDFSAWRDAIFTAAELADESISGPNADPDGDRFPNLIEYVMDGNPKAFTNNPVEHSFDPGGSNVLVMDFPWANGVADYTYALQYSADLVGWEDLEHTVIESVDEGIVTRVSISASVPAGKAGFARLLIVPM